MRIVPINTDENVKVFESSSSLFVTSIFYTLQGEGPYAGHPCIFIRLAGCNYGAKTKVCTQCDTAFQLKNAKVYAVDSLLEEVAQIADTQGCNNIVITGGEPTLQPLIKSFIKRWIERANDDTAFIQIETNGSVPSFYKDDLWKEIKNRVYIVCSPKVNEVTCKYLKIAPDVVANVQAFKFLVSADTDSAYHQIPSYQSLDELYGVNKLYYLSPISVYKKAPNGEVACVFDTDIIDQQATRQNYAYAAHAVMENPRYKLSLQTHLFTAVP